ncbi:hypothetical protein M422DRAFT_272508 [Sphaerobolus stellatus SS14]|uniref:Uncharacterized protein n=1 Tax=Sphaerobolus stellatus (strain SS14) TaxID=990650 RepID=A0A0C9UBG5_SPHS4|nr:hypothetical protein M422DRAFT_272508 [Sphaerobolus stellatus SS14]
MSRPFHLPIPMSPSSKKSFNFKQLVSGSNGFLKRVILLRAAHSTHNIRSTWLSFLAPAHHTLRQPYHISTQSRYFTVIKHMDAATLYAISLALLKRKLGHGLWTPTHDDAYLPAPQIGSVGIVFKGKWVEITKLTGDEVSNHVQTEVISHGEPITSKDSLSLDVTANIELQNL